MNRKEIEKVLDQNFGITLPTGELDTESEYLKKLQEELAKRIEFLIRTNMDKLLQILYRVDVPQKDSDEAFELGEIKKISLKLAENIIRRQLRKIDYSKNFYKRD